jgi:hypothetical protein
MLHALGLTAVVAALGAGCRRDGCVGGDDGTCMPPSACAAVRYTCGPNMSGYLNVADGAVTRSNGPKAMAAPGDITLENDLIRVVIDAPRNPQGLAPSGGSIIDLAPTDRDFGDQINQIYQAAGLLPRDAVRYSGYTIDHHFGSDQADDYVAAVFRGTLDGDRRVTVVTRYELRACEPGVRVRTDIHNGASEPNTLYVTDGYFWGDHGMVPFVPGPGLGFRAPEIDLTEIATAWRTWPFMAARAQAPPEVSYASIPCDRGSAEGFNSTTLTAAGIPLVTTLPGDGIHFERYIVATPGLGLAPAVGEALRVRSLVHGEPAPVTVTGRVVSTAGTPIKSDGGRAASLLFYEPGIGPDPDDPTRRRPWSEAVPTSGDPASEGRFTVVLPRDRVYRLQPYAFGRPAAAPTSFAVARDNVDLGDITIAASARLDVTVTTEPGQPGPQQGTYAELVLIPVDPSSGAAPPSFYEVFPGCNPMLGPPHGGAPACNRALTAQGNFNLQIPPGDYFVYVTRGPFATLKRAQISVGPGEVRQRSFLVQSLPLLPAGAVSGDFHVHGAASYDSSIPDQDRVVSFLATDLDVVVATDHDVVTTYETTLADLSAGGRIIVIPGVEQTPNILWFAVPGEDFPKTLGHFNFWPLARDPALPRNGAPWDELREPGQLMDETAALFSAADPTGVRQLNHPMIDTKLGRDQGFLHAIGYDVRTPIAGGASFAADVLLRAPGGDGKHHNMDWDAQEVMSGISRADWLRHRALWFSLLSQGILRAGTANSDTHTLSVEHAGYPRNIILGDHKGRFDTETFNQAIRDGHIVGTNGPVLQVTLTDADGKPLTDPAGKPWLAGMKRIPVTRESAWLTVRVDAAPWIPLQEIRIFVNGHAKSIDISMTPTIKDVDRLGTEAAWFMERYSLAELIPEPAPNTAPRDVWIVVEAGMKQATPEDEDDDGLPDLSAADIPGQRSDESDPRFHYQAIVPGGWPVAFTNPFLLDLDGDGIWQPPGL